VIWDFIWILELGIFILIIYDDETKYMKSPDIFRISQQTRKQAVDHLIEQSCPKFDFFLLLILYDKERNI
jgi:hypothetical protein